MLLPLLLSLFAWPVNAADGEAPPDGGLASAWTSPAPAATWIIALESSGSLKANAMAARESVARLVESLPDGDSVEVLVLHTRTSPVLPRRTVDGATRATLAAEIRALEIPSAQSSDLGAALSALAASVDTSPDEGARFVLMAGNFCHSPPIGSAWADGGYGCRAIRNFDKLQTPYDATAGHDRVSVLLFPVPSAAQPVHEAGIQEVRTFFEPSGAVRVMETPLADWVEAVRPRLAEERLAPLARLEAATLALTVTVVTQPSARSPRAELRLDTGLPHLGFRASSVDVEGGATSTTSLVFSPTATLQVDVVVPAPPFSLLPRTDTVDIPVRVRVDGRLTPTDTLRAVDIDPERAGVTTEVTLRAERTYGLSAGRSAIFFAGALLFGGAVLLGVRRKLRPLRLGGTLSWRKPGGPRKTIEIENLTEAAIVVHADGSLGVGRREDALVILLVERPLWNTRVTAEIRVPNAEINTRAAAPGRHVVVAGATSLQLLDYRLSWE